MTNPRPAEARVSVVGAGPGGLTCARIPQRHGRPVSEGRLQGAEVTFTAAITSPLKAKIKCAAALDGDAMTGKAKALFLTVPFTATRTPAPGDPS
jgi:hypothetical protein